MRLHAPSTVETDGEAANPGPRVRRRGPRSEDAAGRRRERWLNGSRAHLKVDDLFTKDELITVAHVNVRGWLSNNAHALAQMCLLCPKPEIVVMTETKLNRSVVHPALAGYVLVARKDNGVKAHGGGVLVYVEPKLAPRVTYMGESKEADRVWVMLHSSQGPYLLGAWYRAPSHQSDASLACLRAELESHGRNALGTLLIGDMNVHHASWLSSSCTTAAGEALRDIAADCSLKQMVRGPTHIHGNRLDLVLTSMPDITSVTVGQRVTDHDMILARLRMPMPKTTEITRKVHNFGKADWALLHDSIIEEDWGSIGTANVSDAAESFTNQLRTLIDAAIPQKVVQERKGTHPWIDSQVMLSVQERNRAMGTEHEAAAVAQCSNAMLEARRAYQERTKKELQELPPGSKLWWKRSRELLQQKSTGATIPALKSPTANEWCLSPQSKADVLATTFAAKNKLQPKECDHTDVAIATWEEQSWEPWRITEADV